MDILPWREYDVRRGPDDQFCTGSTSNGRTFGKWAGKWARTLDASGFEAFAQHALRRNRPKPPPIIDFVELIGRDPVESAIDTHRDMGPASPAVNSVSNTTAFSASMPSAITSLDMNAQNYFHEKRNNGHDSERQTGVLAERKRTTAGYTKAARDHKRANVQTHQNSKHRTSQSYSRLNSPDKRDQKAEGAASTGTQHKVAGLIREGLDKHLRR